METKQWSRYNHIFESNESYFIYNSLSNSLGELDQESYLQLKGFRRGKSINLSNLDTDLCQQLLEIKALVDNDLDEINRIRYMAFQRKKRSERLILTINPTLDCNVSCPYCFEKVHPNVYMDDAVEEKIINFINAHSTTKALDVTWFGGEPLLAFDRMVSLTKRMQSLGLHYKAGIITNGYLLSEEIISQLRSLSIYSIQITIDGFAPVHDSRRSLKSGDPTFERIVNNIAILKTKEPNIFVSVRVNVDRSNDGDFVELYKFFHKKQYPNFSVSLAFVNDVSDDKSCSNAYSREEQAQYVLKLNREYGLDFSQLFPSSDRRECAIRNENTVVIGPEGEIYKCWNDVGDPQKVVGNVDGDITNENLLLRYLVAAEPFEDPKCQKCILLPVCGGGCPLSRLQNLYKKSDIVTCPLIKDNMKDFLVAHIEHKERLAHKE